MKDRGWIVVRVDIDPEVKPDICSDIRLFRPLIGFYDFVWASPPCDEFAREGMPWTRTGRPPSLDLVLTSVRLIQTINPRFWAIENVKSSQRYLNPVLGEPRYRSNSHTIWSNVSGVQIPKSGHKSNLSSSKKRERAMIPYELSNSFALMIETKG
jgi:hypothetical protein